ncbi:hypothetical protein AWE03_003036 [Escherichia coli]|nr:hypothetical protein [Escherichia coli]
MTDQAEKKHSAFWGVMVIAGTVIGGGMFALPVDLAGAWFFWGAFILIIAWFSMLHSGLLLLEANLNYPVGSSFNTITKDLIGNTWNIISGIIEFCLLVFSNLAVASSFFGVTLGLFDYLADLFKIDNSHGGRFKTVLLTFLPPALLYLIFPNGFIYGIGGAGLCATIWAVIIPAVLAIKARKKFPNQMFTVWGGNLIPAIVILFGITVILCWFGNVFNVLPKFG